MIELAKKCRRNRDADHFVAWKIPYEIIEADDAYSIIHDMQSFGFYGASISSITNMSDVRQLHSCLIKITSPYLAECNGKYIVFNPYTKDVSILSEEVFEELYKLLPGQGR